MNRYSMLFTFLVASSFALHSTQAGNSGAPTHEEKVSDVNRDNRNSNRTAVGQSEALTDAQQKFIRRFQDKSRTALNHLSALEVLFVTLPHPTETQLASAFDHNVDALQDGLQDAGYLFDSSWIPWTRHEPRGNFDDDAKEKNTQAQEDTYPGILMFRKNGSAEDNYSHGILVFLICEKPTEGIALAQINSALKILKETSISLAGPIRILGPTFSGSFASLIPAIELLRGPEGNPQADVLIRSGGVSGGEDAKAAVREIARGSPGLSINFGSTRYDNAEWIHVATCALRRIGIGQRSIATLSEGESAYGRSFGRAGSGAVSATTQSGESDCVEDSPGSQRNTVAATGNRPGNTGPWSLSFPRDISSLRQEYAKQGIFSASAPAQPWARTLNLNTEERGAGDSIRNFGGAATVAAQESVLFGISEFLKTHGIGAVIVSATNEEDRYFLTQFLHAHNAGVRVVVIGSTRTYMRGSTAQFRGDLVVDDFPMFPRLRDWTGKQEDRIAHLFADSESQGIYFATLDLMKNPSCSDQGLQRTDAESRCSSSGGEWYPEYSAPDWDKRVSPVRRPPMYVAALGSNALWPVTESPSDELLDEERGTLRVEMPFTLFEHWPSKSSDDPPPGRQFRVGRSWKDFFLAVLGGTCIYCVLFWFANPVSGVSLTSFEPSRQWRFWLFKVALPALFIGCAFRLMAIAVEMPRVASSNAFIWWRVAEIMSVMAPALIALSASTKAMFKAKLGRDDQRHGFASPEQSARESLIWHGCMGISFLPALGFLVYLCFSGIYRHDPFAGSSVGAILNCYREMFAESGLSLIPTGLLFLMALLMWASQAGNGAALFEAAPLLPKIPGNPRISQQRAVVIMSVGQPLPLSGNVWWLWVGWIVLAAIIICLHYFAHPFVEITTLEDYSTTCIVRGTAGAITALILLDVLQFYALWMEFRGLLRALDRAAFKRSFVPIQDFKWSNLWSFSGISLQDRRAILGSEIECVIALESLLKDNEKNERESESAKRLGRDVRVLRHMVAKYSATNLSEISSKEYRDDLCKVHRIVASAGSEAASLMLNWESVQGKVRISRRVEEPQQLSNGESGGSEQFRVEAEGVSQLPEEMQTAERLICLIYIGFIQTVVARLHTLLVSVASMFSLVTLGIAIYPFVPFMPLLLAGVVLLALIGWAFFVVFREMDTDPILCRIVDGDDRKLQGSFYRKFIEAIALPLLTLGSSLLPGGTGRLLELAQTLLSQGQ